LCKASTARPHATSVGTLNWQHFCKRLRSLCWMRLSWCTGMFWGCQQVFAGHHGCQ
jgi:hypothetical protein